MQIQTIDQAGQRVSAEVDDNRVLAWRHFLASNPGILGHGAGAQWNKGTARDAGEALAYAVPQLTFMEPGVFSKQYAPLLYEVLLANGVIKLSNQPWATSVTYEISDVVGKGKTIGNGSNDIPYADVATARVEKAIKRGGIAYRYSTEDLRISAYLQRPLPAAKLEAALIAFRSHMNDVALIGEAASNFTGLFNNANVTAGNRPSGAVWDAATADTIIADITALLTLVMTASVQTSSVQVIALPVASYQRLMIPRSTNSDTTVKKFMEESYPGLTFVSVPSLVNLGAGATKRMVGYTPNDQNMVLHITMGPTFLAPQPDDLDIKVPGEYKFGGLEVRRPYTMYYMDGI